MPDPTCSSLRPPAAGVDPDTIYTHALLLGDREVATVRAPGRATIAEIRVAATTVTALTIACDRPAEAPFERRALIERATDHVVWLPGLSGAVHVSY